MIAFIIVTTIMMTTKIPVIITKTLIVITIMIIFRMITITLK